MKLQTDDTLVAARYLRVEPRAEGNSYFLNRAMETGMEAPSATVAVFEFFRSPASVASFLKQYPDVQLGVLESLAGQYLLVRQQDERIFRNGLTTKARVPIGVACTLLSILRRETRATASDAFAVVGAPLDMGAAGAGGARHGPVQIRQHFPVQLAEPDHDARTSVSTSPGATTPVVVSDLDHRRRVSMDAVQVVDVGDVAQSAGESLAGFGARLTWVARQVIDAGFRPVMLGGDHSLTRFMLRPLLDADKQPFGIIHFDAHTDLYELPDDELSHGNPFDEALASPNLRCLFQVGLRELRTDRGAPLRDRRLAYASARDVWNKKPKGVFRGLPKGIPWYLTFDIDCMDPGDCPETGTPLAGGLRYYDVLELLDYLLGRETFLGVDFVEVSGPLGGLNRSASVAASLLAQFILGHGRFAPLASQMIRDPALWGSARKSQRRR